MTKMHGVNSVKLIDSVLHYLKFKFNRCQYSFTKCKSTITNSVIYLECITPLISSQLKLTVYILVLVLLWPCPLYLASSCSLLYT
jgi:hypothetical protein